MNFKMIIIFIISRIIYIFKIFNLNLLNTLLVKRLELFQFFD